MYCKIIHLFPAVPVPDLPGIFQVKNTCYIDVSIEFYALTGE